MVSESERVSSLNSERAKNGYLKETNISDEFEMISTGEKEVLSGVLLGRI